MVILRAPPPPTKRPWEDVPHLEFRLYRDPVKMARSYNSLMVNLQRLLLRESARDDGGTQYYTEGTTPVADGEPKMYTHKILHLPKAEDTYFVVVMYPPPDLADGDDPMEAEGVIKLLFSFTSLYLLGFFHSDLWNLFDDAIIEGISRESQEQYTTLLGFKGDYKTIGQNYMELIMGFNGQCDTLRVLAGFGHFHQKLVIRALCRTVVTISEARRFPFLLKCLLRNFHSGDFDKVLDIDVLEEEEYKNFSFHFNHWSSYCGVIKRGESEFVAVPKRGRLTYHSTLNFIAVLTTKDHNKPNKDQKNNRHSAAGGGDSDDEEEGGHEGPENDDDKDKEKRGTDKSSAGNTSIWFYQSPVMPYVFRMREANCIKALEAARLACNKYMAKSAVEDTLHFRVPVHRFHVLLINKMLWCAGADRLQTGMRGAFGKPQVTCAQVAIGQVLHSMLCMPNNAIHASKSLRRAKFKFPSHQRIAGSRMWGSTKFYVLFPTLTDLMIPETIPSSSVGSQGNRAGGTYEVRHQRIAGSRMWGSTKFYVLFPTLTDLMIPETSPSSSNGSQGNRAGGTYEVRPRNRQLNADSVVGSGVGTKMVIRRIWDIQKLKKFQVAIPKKTGTVSVRGVTLAGTRHSAKMDRTITVRRNYLHLVKKYQRYEKAHQHSSSHLPMLPYKEGDHATIGQCRLLSKTVSSTS